MSLSLFLQQRPNCLGCLIWMVCEMALQQPFCRVLLPGFIKNSIQYSCVVRLDRRVMAIKGYPTLVRSLECSLVSYLGHYFGGGINPLQVMQSEALLTKQPVDQADLDDQRSIFFFFGEGGGFFLIIICINLQKFLIHVCSHKAFISSCFLPEIVLYLLLLCHTIALMHIL